MAAELPIVRSCGDCQACCRAIRVQTDPEDKHQIQKPHHQPCQHQGAKGCGIYEERPRCCAVFTCMWLHGWGRNSDRPDRLGLIFEPVNPLLPGVVLVTEVTPGARMGGRAGQLVRAMAAKVGKAFVLRQDKPPVLVSKTGVEEVLA